MRLGNGNPVDTIQQFLFGQVPLLETGEGIEQGRVDAVLDIH